MPVTACDIAILGGGLSGALIALAIAHRRPDLRLALIEREVRFGGDHVWSFFDSDVDAAGMQLVEPMIAARWQGYDVHFPGHSRRLSRGYASVTGTQLDAAVRARLPETALVTGRAVLAADAGGVMLEDGHRIAAAGVIDARGAAALPHLTGGWQKFVGQTLRLSAPHGLTRPVVMDARVEQVDGYRFVYCLPFGEREIFVEDTYYSDDPMLDRPALAARIAQYAARQGWQVDEVAYAEAGVLPVIAGGDFARFWAAGDTPRPGSGGLARAGTCAALVHPLTSYSLPDAVRFANYLSGLDNLTGDSLRRASDDWAAKHWRDGRFYRMLSAMLFGAAAPGDRWRVLERFYRLPEPLIERFYAGQSTMLDKLRVLSGKPPVPVLPAMASLAGRGRPLADLGVAGGGRP